MSYVGIKTDMYNRLSINGIHIIGFLGDFRRLLVL
jgi:hypothetical protein